MYTNKNITLSTNKFIEYLITRFKHKDTHWSVQRKKKNATGKALEHFDDFYKTVFNKSWPSIRQGLLSDNKYVAVVNNYSDNEKIITRLENIGALNLRTLFNLEKRYIKEKQESKREEKLLENIHNLDKKLELKSNISNQATADQFIRQTKEEKLENNIVKVASMTESLKTAQYDYSRIVQPGNADLSSALYQFIPCTKLKGKDDWILESQHYRYYETTNSFKVEIEKEYNLHFPENLNIYCFERSNQTHFESPGRGSTDVLDYYLLDGGSVLPILALGLKPGDRFLDMCAAPGGKSLIALQTLYPEFIVCNDVDNSRIKRIHNVFNQYLYDLDKKWFSTNKLKVIQEDARYLELRGFDCILVDVPCTNDRLSVKETDNNWFKSSRTKERLQLPESQAALLFNALKIVNVGGTVVYSTCSLSPVQNDGVVNMALKQIWEETDVEIIVKDLSPALQVAECCYKFAEQKLLRCGHLIVPYLPQNYGPMYFCKLQRIK